MKVYLTIALIWVALNLGVTLADWLGTIGGTWLGLSFIGLGLYGLIRVMVKLTKGE